MSRVGSIIGIMGLYRYEKTCYLMMQYPVPTHSHIPSVTSDFFFKVFLPLDEKQFLS